MKTYKSAWIFSPIFLILAPEKVPLLFFFKILLVHVLLYSTINSDESTIVSTEYVHRLSQLISLLSCVIILLVTVWLLSSLNPPAALYSLKKELYTRFFIGFQVLLLGLILPSLPSLPSDHSKLVQCLEQQSLFLLKLFTIPFFSDILFVASCQSELDSYEI